MKLTNAEIYNATEPLKKLMEQTFPVKTSLALVKLSRKIGEQYVMIEEVRNGLVKKYGEVNPANVTQLMVRQMIPKLDNEGNPVVVNEVPEMELNPNFEKFVLEHNELMLQETEIVFEPVELPDTLEIDPATLMALEAFIKA